MVEKVLKMINKEFHSTSQAALVLGLFTLLSQVLALLRDRSLAHFLGPSAHLDVYYAAFKVPDLLYVSVGSLVSITVVIPFLIKRMENGGTEKENKEKASLFMNQLFTVFVWFIIVLSTLVFILMPKIANLIAPGFDPEETRELILMSRIMLFSPLFMGISNVLGSITQYYKNFFLYSLSPVFYNLGIIFGVLFLYPILGIYGLGVGVVLGAIFHFAIQLPLVTKKGFLPKFVTKIDWKIIREVSTTSLPRTLTLSLNTLTLLVITAIASSIAVGSISIFTFSYNLETVPLNIIGVSYSIAAFPLLAQAFASGQIEKFVEHAISSAKQIIFWSIPATVLFIVLRAQIVRVILGSGNFTWSDTRLTAAALAIFAISITLQGLTLLLIRSYYAAGKTKRPLFINMFSSVLTIVLCFVLTDIYQSNPNLHYAVSSFLRVENSFGTTILMLPLAYTMGATINFFILWGFFKYDFLRENKNPLRKVFLQSFGASVVLGGISYMTLSVLGPLFGLDTFWGVFGQGLIAGIFGIIACVGILVAMKNREMEEVMKALKRKISKSVTVAPGPEDLSA